MEPKVVREAFFDDAGQVVPAGDPRAVSAEVVYVDEDGTERRVYATVPPAP